MQLNLIAIFDLISFSAAFFALLVLIRCWRKNFLLHTKIVLTGLLCFTIIYNFFLLLEWSGIATTLDAYEDFTGALLPMWWAFVFFAFFHEISNRSLRRSEENFRTVLQSTPNPIIVYDPNDRVLYFNPSFSRVFGWELQECIGKPLENFIPATERHKTKKLMDKLYNNENFEFEKSTRYTINSDLISVSICGNPYKNEDGKIIGSVFNLQDISEKETLEAQLRQSQKMDAIGTLAGGIAHDFNNILSLIIGYTELALDDIDKNSATHDNLKEVLAAGIRAKKLVNQILTFSRSGKNELELIRLQPIIDEVESLLRATLPTSISIEKNICLDAFIIADPTQIHQVLVNLGTNAGHAMENSGGTLSIEMNKTEIKPKNPLPHPGMEIGEYIQIKVKDTGHGMPPEIIERIFDPFFTTKEIGKGTGMGLAVAQGIISSLGGKITVSSIVDKGTTFAIFIPARTSVFKSN